MKKREYSMEISIALMVIIAAILIVVSFFSKQTQMAVYESFWFILFMASFAILTLWCVFSKKLTLARIGFVICHIGVVLFLVGAFLGAQFMIKKEVVKPVEDGRYIPYYELSEIVGTNKLFVPKTNSFMTMGFDFNITDFKIQYYDDKQTLVKSFIATAKVTDGEKSFTKEIKVNHPLTYNGWRVYLMDYDHKDGGSYLILTVRKDIGSLPVIIGLWSIIIGTFILCFRKNKEADINV